jgi:hypothetical protein
MPQFDSDELKGALNRAQEGAATAIRSVAERRRVRAEIESGAVPPPRVSPDRFEKVRETPKGTRLVKLREGEFVVLKFRAAIRFWYLVAFAAVPAVFVLGGPIGFAASLIFRTGPYGLPNTGAYFWVFVILSVLAYLAIRRAYPWVTLIATPQYIKVGKLYFDRGHYGGMRTGYEISTSAGLLKNDFHDLGIGLVALRLSYGLWGEDLPYLVNRYHGAEIVIWMNYMIGLAEAEKEPSPQTGVRSQQY